MSAAPDTMRALNAHGEQLLAKRAELEVLLGRPLARREGECDLCGRWDTSLAAGVGACCRNNALVRPTEKPLRGVGRKRFLPCNAHLWDQLARAQAAMVDLDDQSCLVAHIELGGPEPVLSLARAPGEGVVASRHELVRTGDDHEPQRIGRAEFRGCLLEWLVP